MTTLIETADAVNLKEYDEVEWRDVCRRLRPDWSDEKIAEEWRLFIDWKARRAMQ